GPTADAVAGLPSEVLDDDLGLLGQVRWVQAGVAGDGLSGLAHVELGVVRAGRRQLVVRRVRDVVTQHVDLVKVFDTTDFGYQRITVERPLRLRYRVGDGTLDEIQAAKAWAKLTDDERAAVTRALDPVHGLDTTDRDVAAKHLTEHGPVPKPIDKAVWTAISVRDPDAPVVKNKKGEPEPDPE